MSIKKIGIIYSDLHPLIIKAAEYIKNAGISAEMIHWQSITYNGTQSNIDNFSVIYLDRMGELTRSYATQIRALQLGCNVPVVNHPESYWSARDKGLAAFSLRAAGILTPPTSLYFDLEGLMNSLDNKQSYVAKSTLGCCAEDILVFQGNDVPYGGIKQILQRDGMVCLQEYIANPDRFIWRIDIVNGNVVVCNQRFSYVEGRFPICNGTQGGKIIFWDPSDLPDAVRSVAISAMKALNLKVGGVDIIPDEQGQLYVLEVNPEPDITLDRYEFPRAIAHYLVSLAEGAPL